MSTKERWDGTHREYCRECEDSTPHEVYLDIRKEGKSKYSTQPWTISKCLICGNKKEDRSG